jgi:hypothetical protein
VTTEQIVAIFKWVIALVLVAGGIVLIAMSKIDTTEFVAMLAAGLAALGLGQVVQKKVGQ